MKLGVLWMIKQRYLVPDKLEERVEHLDFTNASDYDFKPYSVLLCIIRRQIKFAKKHRQGQYHVTLVIVPDAFKLSKKLTATRVMFRVEG